jgi:hypothetical protein
MSAATALMAGLLLACAAPLTAPAKSPPAATGDAWVTSWKPQLDSLLQARTAFGATVSSYSATYAETAQAADDLANSALHLRDAMAATAPPTGQQADATAAEQSLGAAIVVLPKISACSASAPTECSLSKIYATWCPADAALVAGFAPFVAIPGLPGCAPRATAAVTWSRS